MSETIRAILVPELSIGGELEIANAARRSFDTKHGKLDESDLGLVRFLIREKHWLPFRHPQLSFDCSAPIFVARQLVKHQTGLSWSESSRRYLTRDIGFWMPDEWRARPEGSIKQGRGDPLPEAAQVDLNYRLGKHHRESFELYEKMLEMGVAPEQARAVLPQSMVVKWIWTGSLLAWLHLVRERTHQNVQVETEQFARIIAEVIKERFPNAWQAFAETINFDPKHIEG